MMVRSRCVKSIMDGVVRCGALRIAVTGLAAFWGFTRPAVWVRWDFERRRARGAGVVRL